MSPPNDNGNISAKVVVCVPLKWYSEISPVTKSSSGAIALINDDLPTPELPDINVSLSFNTSLTLSMPIFFSTDVVKTL